MFFKLLECESVQEVLSSIVSRFTAIKLTAKQLKLSLDICISYYTLQSGEYGTTPLL